MTERRVPLWRPVLSWLFLIIFCLAAPVDLVAGWARQTATDTESYTRTVSGLAADPRLQDAVAQAVAHERAGHPGRGKPDGLGGDHRPPDGAGCWARRRGRSSPAMPSARPGRRPIGRRIVC